MNQNRPGRAATDTAADASAEAAPAAGNDAGPDISSLPGGADVSSLPGGARAALEAVLMVIDQPATATELATGLDLPVDAVEGLLVELQREYNGYTVNAPDVHDASFNGFSATPRGFELRNIAGGWRIYSRAEFADIVGGFVLEGQTARLTQAALETLAVIAYRQPVSRARVSAIRGVNVDSVVRTLTQRGLIEDSGTDPESGAILYRTTSYFLERMGIGSVAELPQLSPHLPGLEGIEEFYDAGRM